VFRRFITAVLIISYLATGAAGTAHAHAKQSPDHGARPHVHLDWLTQLFGDSVRPRADEEPAHHHHHHHGHDHGDHGHHHHDDGNGDSNDDSGEKPDSPVPAGDFGDDHDSTCIYIADGALGVTLSKSLGDLGWVVAQIAVLGVTAGNTNDLFLLRPQRAHAPPGAQCAGADLILKLRTLRI
jgi:hypothetical protein